MLSGEFDIRFVSILDVAFQKPLNASGDPLIDAADLALADTSSMASKMILSFGTRAIYIPENSDEVSDSSIAKYHTVRFALLSQT